MKGGEINMTEDTKLPDGTTVMSQIRLLDQLIYTTSKKVFGDTPSKVENKVKVYKGRIGALIGQINGMIKTVEEINKELKQLGK